MPLGDSYMRTRTPTKMEVYTRVDVAADILLTACVLAYERVSQKDMEKLQEAYDIVRDLAMKWGMQ